MSKIKIFVFVLSCLIVISCNPVQQEMSVSTNSDVALELYKSAYKEAQSIIKIKKSISTYEQAVEEDPTLFMAYYQLASFHLFYKNYNEYGKFSDRALELTNLNKGEEILQQVLKAWSKNISINVTSYGMQLIQNFPNDPDAYFNLGFYYYKEHDYLSAINMFEHALSMDNPNDEYCGPLLGIVPERILGYLYILTDQHEKASNIFDAYIQKKPNSQNPYECKGDYFMATREYMEAHDCYMKAFELDTSYQIFLHKAQNAQKLYLQNQPVAE